MQILQLEEGEDFQSKISTFIYMARKKAKARGGHLNANKVDMDGKPGVVIQFVEGPAEGDTDGDE